MDQLFESVIDRVRVDFPLTEVELDPAIARPKSILKIMDATHYNWEADRFRKLFGMRFKVKLPPLNQLNTIFYPEQTFDTPIFLFFVLVTKRKLIAHINIYCPFNDADYLAKHVAPKVEILNRYPSFECEDRYPDWMANHRQPCSIYGMFPRDRLEDVEGFAREFLDHYLTLAKEAEAVTDEDRLARIKEFHAGFIDDIRTQDKAQGMIAKMIGKAKARRIFYEITT